MKIKVQLSKKARLKIQALKNQRFLVPEFSKKAQLKIQEMAFMLVAIVFFFILVGLFLASIFYTNLYKEANRISESKTISAVTNLADSPEFSCVTSKSNCVDSDKLISLIDKQSYKNFWQFTSLTVIKSSAFDKSEDEMTLCSLGNYPRCNKFVVYDRHVKNEKKISSYIALCRKEYENSYVYEKCEIAKLVAGVEVKVQGQLGETSEVAVVEETNKTEEVPEVGDYFKNVQGVDE